VTWSVQPEPANENELQALLTALERALAEEQVGGEAYTGAWWRAGLEDLGRGPAPQESWRDPGIVEP
jgi:hypothetical protein